MNNIFANKGMYLEEVINRTINYLLLHKIAYIEKRNVPFKIIKKVNDNFFLGKLIGKSTVDYIGTYKNKRWEFEAKEVDDIFNFANIKKHQFIYLDNMLTYENCICFIIVFVKQINKFYLILFKTILDYKKSFKRNYMSIEELNKFSYELKIVYPGILNLIECMNKISQFQE